MLYCPKCRKTYTEESQRFCLNDGGRLLPVSSARKNDSQVSGIFTSILGKMQSRDEKNQPESFSKTEFTVSKKYEHPASQLVLKTSPAQKILKNEMESEPRYEPSEILDEEESLLELELPAPPVRKDSSVKTEPIQNQQNFQGLRLVKPGENPTSMTPTGDRQTDQPGRNALSRENLEALIGQTIKGRYLVREKLREDDKSLVFLAEDKFAANKKVVVHLLVVENEKAAHLADEIILLLHFNHPDIAAVFDSGELSEGYKFIVSEFVEGKSLKEMLQKSGQFNSQRAARIIRQVAYALSEAHQNGILHRNLKPENIILTVSGNGVEKVKLVDFGLYTEDSSDEALLYKSPEEINGEAPTYASEIFSLAAIGYEMLTKRLPFNAFSTKELLKLQKEGLAVPPTALRIDVPPLTDKILEKALAFEPTDRYPKARDFGDAFFYALTTVAPWEVEERETGTIEVIIDQKEKSVGILDAPTTGAEKDTEFPISSDIHITSKRPETDFSAEEPPKVPTVENLAWEKRSPEFQKLPSLVWGVMPIIGALLILSGLWGIWKFLSSRTGEMPQTENAEVSNNLPPVTVQDSILPDQNEVDRPPQPRNQKQPPDTVRFINNQESLKGDLAKNFLGFEVFYPQSWKKEENSTNFLDISKKNNEGYPLEQMLITYYTSRGTMTLDRENFPKLAEKSNNDLRKIIGDSYKVLSSGETVIQNGRWKGYEVKFQGLLPDGKTIIWGRRLWIPVQSPGIQNGFVLTLLATSLSDQVKSIEDVGTKGDLAEILESFEPEQRF